jgi:hypothetical protein
MSSLSENRLVTMNKKRSGMKIDDATLVSLAGPDSGPSRSGGMLSLDAIQRRVVPCSKISHRLPRSFLLFLFRFLLFAPLSLLFLQVVDLCGPI